MKQFKVHVGFITSNGVIIRPGIYDDGTFDVAEARRRSYITEVNGTDIQVPVEHKASDNVITDIKFEPVKNADAIELIDIRTKPTENQIKPVDINKATETEIIGLAYVGKKTAQKVIALRKEVPFTDYQDLDKRVPLTSKSWEDVGYILFEYKLAVDNTSLGMEVIETGSSNAKQSKSE
jgi:DNA uptake protein ComE-like DNA-binding protein